MKLIRASDLPLADLAAVWRAAYDGYYVPLQFDEAQLARHIRWSGIDLELSVVAELDSERAGLSLVARADGEAWIGGFGIAPAHRRMGLATRLISEHTALLDAGGVARTRLEVIDINPAREAYARAGFQIARNLLVLEAELAEEGAAGVFADREDLAEAHARLHPRPPSWRRGLPRLLNILDDTPARIVGVERGGRLAAFAVILDQPGRFGLFDAAAEDEAAGAALLEVLAFCRAGARTRIVDEPLGSPLATALQAAGWRPGLRQFEMVRPRPAA